MPKDVNKNVSPGMPRRLQEGVSRQYGADAVPREYVERGSKPSKPASIAQPEPVPVPPPPVAVPTQGEKK